MQIIPVFSRWQDFEAEAASRLPDYLICCTLSLVHISRMIVCIESSLVQYFQIILTSVNRFAALIP